VSEVFTLEELDRLVSEVGRIQPSPVVAPATCLGCGTKWYLMEVGTGRYLGPQFLGRCETCCARCPKIATGRLDSQVPPDLH